LGRKIKVIYIWFFFVALKIWFLCSLCSHHLRLVHNGEVMPLIHKFYFPNHLMHSDGTDVKGCWKVDI
jgi:hypothetical protein